MSNHSTDDDPTATDPTEDALDELDTETVEDLDADENAEDVRGGTTWDCRGGHHN